MKQPAELSDVVGIEMLANGRITERVNVSAQQRHLPRIGAGMKTMEPAAGSAFLSC